MDEQMHFQVDCQELLDAAQNVLPESGVVTLKPILKILEDRVTISLKAGEGRVSYIRDVPAFFEAIRDRQPFPISKNFTYSPAWMRLDKASQSLCDQLFAYLETLSHSNQPLTGMSKRDIPLSGSMLKLVLNALVAMDFVLTLSPKQEHEQNGIEQESLPLLFRLGYDIRGVVLTGSWQENVQAVVEDGSFVIMKGRLFQLSLSDALLMRTLPKPMEGEEFTIPFSRSQTPRVFAELLPFLQRSHAVVMEEDLQERLLQYPLKARIYLDSEGSGIAARVAFVYGDLKADPFSHEQNLPAYLLRDAAGERKIMDLLAQYGFRARTGRADLQNTDLIFEFLMKGVSDLHRLGEVYLSQAFRQLTPRAPSFSAHMRMRSGRISLELADDGQFSDELLPLMQALSKRKKYFRYKNGAFITLDDAREWQALADAYLESLAPQQDERDLPAMRAHYLAALIDKSQLPVTFDEGTRNAVALDPERITSPVDGLFAYQLRGFRWICALNILGLGGILADEMGLGKTVQMIAAIAYFARSEPVRLPSLIVSPTTLLYNWQSEIERFAPNLCATVISGSKPIREKLLEEALKDESNDVIITSYPLLRQDIALYENLRFRFAVLDEAQNIKNFTSQTARTAKRINAHTRLALTGTPMENNVTELWSLFDFVLPGYLFSAREFIRRYEDGRHAEELRLRIRPFLMRRLKSDVMAELPEKLSTTMYCEMGAEQRRVYQAALLKSRTWVNELMEKKGLDGSRIEVLSAITLMRQLCCHPLLMMEDYAGDSAKLDLLMEVLPDALKSGRRILLFSQFTSMLKIIRARLDEAGIPSLYLDGETGAQERVLLADRFNQGQVPVFLISLKAGGTGLNLTGADMVIHYDPWWNPTAEDQANDRAHRLGQDKTVQILHLITRKSIEEAVVEMGRRKRRLFDRLITPGETMPQKLSQSDVLRLFEK
ncbi:MAG: DEAD/DEAH box helicase family protein [Clostridiales bacterium]|nr:DEAD/DEAH box helicase family protein [Clostridiales bacterium]